MLQLGISAQPPSTLSKASPSSVGISSERLDLLDSHIKKFIDEGNLPGGVFLLARRGKIVYFENHGHQSLDKNKTYQKDNIFRLASMTKAFTVVSIMQLYEQGKLGLDDPIFYYLPSFAQHQILDKFNEADSTFTTRPTKKKITIRHLLTHTSGITYGVFTGGNVQIMYDKFGANNFGLSHDKMSTRQMVNQLGKVPLIFEPGEQYSYGLNMEILGGVIEVASGMSLDEYFKKNIFEPLGMKETHFYLPKHLHEKLVPLYSYDKKKKINMGEENPLTDFVNNFPKQADNNHYAGGGGASGSTMDYAIFIQTLLNGGVYNGKRILSRKTIEVMTADQMIQLNENGKGYNTGGFTFGLGFEVKTKDGMANSHKSPGTYGWGGYFNTKFFIDPQEELIFVGMSQIVPFYRPDFWEKTYAIIYGSIDD